MLWIALAASAIIIGSTSILIYRIKQQMLHLERIKVSANKLPKIYKRNGNLTKLHKLCYPNSKEV